MISQKTSLFHLKFNSYSPNEILSIMHERIENRKQSLIVPVNVDMLRLSYYNTEFKDIINDSTISIIDGKPLIWLAKIYKKKLKYKISGSDLIYPVLELCNDNNYSILIVGGKEEVAAQACVNIKNKYKNIRFAKYYAPKFGFEKNDVLIKETIKNINIINANVVLLCLGAPKQELFYNSNKNFLANSIYICSGATVDFLANSIKRAPKWMSNCGLEWLYRLLKEPKRLFRRYLLDLLFIPKIIVVSLFKK